jgi:hypothetical protein
MQQSVFCWLMEPQLRHSLLRFAALMMGHHFPISAFCNAPRASGVCWARGKVSCARSASRARIIGSAKAAVTAAFNLAMIFFGVPFGSQSPCHWEMSNPGAPRPALGCQARIASGFLWFPGYYKRKFWPRILRLLNARSSASATPSRAKCRAAQG